MIKDYASLRPYFCFAETSLITYIEKNENVNHSQDVPAIVRKEGRMVSLISPCSWEFPAPDIFTHEGTSCPSSCFSFGKVFQYEIYRKNVFASQTCFVQDAFLPKFSFQENFCKSLIIGNFKNPLVSREQLNNNH